MLGKEEKLMYRRVPERVPAEVTEMGDIDGSTYSKLEGKIGQH